METQPHFVYILYSKSHDVYYKGVTTNVENRLHRHNHGFTRYTKHKRPWVLVYSQEFPSKLQRHNYGFSRYRSV